MTLTAVVDVAIGLILVFLLVGLLVSTLQEILAGYLSVRGKLLKRALAGMLSAVTADGSGKTLLHGVTSHALVADLVPSKMPSYVPPANFTLALIDALKPDDGSRPLFSQIESGVAALPDGPAKQSLQAFLTEAAGDLSTFKKRIESWYGDTMDRMSGVYKRWSQVFALLAGLAVAIAFNIDTIAIAKTLWVEPQARAAIVAQAQKLEEKDLDEKDVAAVWERLGSLPVPVGWTDAPPLGFNMTNLWRLVGWLLTALAASLGAPFWFDTLQKFLKFRASGPKPQEPEK